MTESGPTLATPPATNATEEATVYLSLGANLEDRRAAMRCAIERLANTDGISLELSRDVASLYETTPVGCPGEQPPYLNTVVRLRTTLSPRSLLEVTQEIERALGRTRREANEPRVIDIDILVYGTLEYREADLTLPHPRMMDRRFVLDPLMEIAPQLRVPATTTTISDASRSVIGRLSGQRIRRVADAGWAATDA